MEYFIWPFVALLIPLPWIVRRLLPDIYSKNAGNRTDALRVSFFDRVAGLAHGKPPLMRTKMSIFMLLAWFCFIVAGMRPVLYENEIPAFHEARNIMLAIDFSGSMAKRDFDVSGRPISRIEIVKNVVRDFIAKRVGDRLGLVVFGSNAYTLAPLSQDMATLDELFADVGLGIAGEQTAIGDALALSVQDTAKVPAGKKIIILLSDGYSNAGNITVEQAIDLAKSQGIAVYTIGVGSAHTTNMKLVGATYDWDEETLKQIASETRGKYFRAASTKDLIAVYRKIDQLETTEIKGHSIRPRREFFFYPLLLGLFLWFLAQKRRKSS